MAALPLLLSSCGTVDHVLMAGASPWSPGDTATWELLDAAEISPVSRTVRLGVTRLGCADGETGRVLEPEVDVQEDQVVIRTMVEPLPGGAYTCPGNDAVPVTVDLAGEELGARELVDGACLEGEAASTAACADGASRWSSPARTATEEVPAWPEPAGYTFVVNSQCGERALIGRYAVTVTGGRATAVEAIADTPRGLALRDAMTIGEMLEEARHRGSHGAKVRVATDEDGVPVWVAIGESLSMGDATSCYAISEFQHTGR